VGCRAAGDPLLAEPGRAHVNSAGNINADLRHSEIGACIVLPAEAPGVVTVSAVGVERRKSYCSSYGLGVVELAAPGVDTRQPDPDAAVG
jgi:hypothetical protein